MARTRMSPATAIPERSAGTDAAGRISRLSQVFINLTQGLRERFEIDKGVLIVRRGDSQTLAAVSTWSDGLGRDGLTINLPGDSSLFEQVAQHGQVYTESYCKAFSGNFFERKLLLDENSRSFVLMPLKSEGHVVGLLGYSSQQPTAFTLFEEGELDSVAEQLGQVIASNGSRSVD
ncbi:MAG: GAF domain-containing protein [Candidatus Zixiibacteriota bacterium]